MLRWQFFNTDRVERRPCAESANVLTDNKGKCPMGYLNWTGLRAASCAAALMAAGMAHAQVGYTISPELLIGLIDVREVKRSTLTAALAARVGVTKRFEMELRAPYVYRADSTRDTPDLSLTVRLPISF
jgi:hypothetical protein